MKRSLLILSLLLASTTGFAAPRFFGALTVQQATPPALHSAAYRAFSVDGAALAAWLETAPAAASEAGEISLPMPDGTLRAFRAWSTPVMPAELSRKYPGIYTLTATAVDNPAVTAKLDWSPAYGFRAMILDGARTVFIDPYSGVSDGRVISYFRKDYSRASADLMRCEVTDDDIPATLSEPGTAGAQKLHGATRRTYRLAVACTGEYSAAVTTGQNPPVPLTKANVLARVVTSVNRVNGVYENELAITLTLIPNNDTLIYLNGTTDPYSNGNGSTMLGQNQTNVTTIIGTANFDMGHVFSTGGGGVAVAGVCNTNNKARGVTGQTNPVGDPFDIDYVAHEMGHQFSASHTFNSTAGSCGGNGVSSSAFEPGSGSTIMAYAGICPLDNLQPNSDAYFHARSLDQITNYITTGTASTCPVATPTGNDIPVVPAFDFQDTLYIPLETHFELTAPVAQTTLASAPLTYCWEQYNAGSLATFANTTAVGPLFRSYRPDTVRTRVFPRLAATVLNVTNDNVGEKLPTVARTLRFTLTVRDVYNGIGAFSWAEDTIQMRAVNTGAPFRVTSQGAVIPTPYLGASTQTVTWDVAGTTAAPVNAATVDIFYSLDSGYTYPYALATGVPNNGSAQVVLPNVTTLAGRIKVKAANNVFFDLNNAAFPVLFDPIAASVSAAPAWADAVTVFPVPTSETLTVRAPAGTVLSATVMNALGQMVWRGAVKGTASIGVGRWAKGVYTLQLVDSATGTTSVKRIVVD